MIIGHGIDLVDIEWAERFLAEPSGQFLARYFTETERGVVEEGREVAARLSGRLAAKEAVMKALGTGFSGGIGFQQIEVITLPSGAPSIQLHGAAAEKAKQLGVVRWLVSTSHEGNMAIASVIALGDQDTPR